MSIVSKFTTWLASRGWYDEKVQAAKELRTEDARQHAIHSRVEAEQARDEVALTRTKIDDVRKSARIASRRLAHR